jgi:C-terminal processing protease CtpA/Prc
MAYSVIPNSLVIGSTTAGADGDRSQFFLPGGITTFITGTGIYYPDGRETQRCGVKPDIIVKPNIESIKQKKDVVLEKAIELIEKK